MCVKIMPSYSLLIPRAWRTVHLCCLLLSLMGDEGNCRLSEMSISLACHTLVAYLRKLNMHYDAFGKDFTVGKKNRLS